MGTTARQGRPSPWLCQKHHRPSRRYFNPSSEPLELDSRFWELRDSIVQCELLVLRVLRFQVSFQHPHKVRPQRCCQCCLGSELALCSVPKPFPASAAGAEPRAAESAASCPCWAPPALGCSLFPPAFLLDVSGLCRLVASGLPMWT